MSSYREDYGMERRLMHFQKGRWVKMWELGVRGKMRHLGVQYYLMGNVPRHLMCSSLSPIF